MKVKFNKFERVAGLFVLTTILGGFVILVGVAVKQGWFETKVKFKTTFKNADGVREGTSVQMAGLRAGAVTSVELRSNNVVHVQFEISEKYLNLVRQDSVVRLLRPFVISEKVLDISVGDMQLPQAIALSELKSEATSDIMDLVSGKTLMPYVETMSSMFENLRVVAEAILDPNRSKDIIRIFDQLNPLVTNLNFMSKEMAGLLKDTNKNKKLVHMIDGLALTTQEVNKMLPELNKIMPAMAELAVKDGPKLTADLGKIAHTMALLTDELQKTLPTIKSAMTELGPEIPRATRRAMEALDETVVTLKALQKSFILRGNTKEVRDEEAERERQRMPAKEKSPAQEEK